MSDPSTIATLEAQALGLLDTIRILKQAAEATSEAPIVITAPALPTPANDPVDLAFTDIGRFYDFLRSNSMLGPKINAAEFAGCQAVLTACINAGFSISFAAYALATAYHETAHTMQPIKEYGGDAYYTRMYDIKGNRPDKAKELGNLTPGDGARYCGRGYVQLTGKKNYAYAGQRLGVDLVNHPELAMRPDVAAQIMALGMKEGWFTHHTLPADLPATGTATRSQFTVSRDIINGKDRADMIAGYSVDFQSALQRGGYKLAA
jgi:putative chitinase